MSLSRPIRPATLQAQAEDQANAEHNRRMAELQALAPLLAQLDRFTPAFAEQKLTVRLYGLHLYHHHVGSKRFKVLRMDTRGVFFTSGESARWLAALTDLGFTEVERDSAGTVYPTVLLRRGQLLLRVDATPPAAPVANVVADVVAAGEPA